MIKYYARIDDLERIYKIENSVVFRWSTIRSMWRPYPFIRMWALKEIVPEQYTNHPAFAKINFYKELLDEQTTT